MALLQAAFDNNGLENGDIFCNQPCRSFAALVSVVSRLDKLISDQV